MVETLKFELKEIYAFLKRNYYEVVITATATAGIIFCKYYTTAPQLITFPLCYVLFPLVIIIFVLRENPIDYGLGLGNYRVWGFHLLLAMLIITILLLVVSGIGSLNQYYSIRNFNLFGETWKTFLKIFSFEFIIRGFLLFGLKKRFKEGAILIQMIPFAILHFGKPFPETIGCIASGIYFGYLAYRTNSIWPVVLLHFFANIMFKAIVHYL